MFFVTTFVHSCDECMRWLRQVRLSLHVHLRGTSPRLPILVLLRFPMYVFAIRCREKTLRRKTLFFVYCLVDILRNGTGLQIFFDA